MTTAINRPARVGLITDQTGALSFMGIANVNIAKMLIDDINDRGGLLGRPVELFVEDSATDDKVAETAAARLIERTVDVVVGGIYSSTATPLDRPEISPDAYDSRRSNSESGNLPMPTLEGRWVLKWDMNREPAPRNHSFRGGSATHSQDLGKHGGHLADGYDTGRSIDCTTDHSKIPTAQPSS